MTIDVILDDDNEEIIVYLNEGDPDGLTEAGVQVVTNKTIDFSLNTLTGVQPLLVSGVDIKTVNGGSVLGAGNISTGDVYGPAASVDSEVVLFSAGGGKTLKRATITGLAKLVAGVLSAAVAGTDFVAPGGGLGTPTSGNVGNCTVDGTQKIGFRGIPLVSASAATTVTKALHAGGGLKHPSADTTARTYTIDSNANQSWVDGTAVTILNCNGAGVVTIAVTTDTMRKAGDGTTGSRTLAANGIATLIWDAATTTWYISGVGLT